MGNSKAGTENRESPADSWGRHPVTVGAFRRRQFRAVLDLLDVSVREYRGLFQSEFVLECTDAKAEAVADWVTAMGGIVHVE